jgi:membrane associated rhomboid family serine protease
MGIIEEIKYSFSKGDYLVKLIYINIGIFLLANIISVVNSLMAYSDTNFATQYLSMPAYLPGLARHFWTPFTYMFLHEGFLHILFNMLWLFWMGRIFVEYLSSFRLLSVYLAGGLAGAALYLLAYNTLPAFSPSAFNLSYLMGASASVMAIVIAVAAYVPNYSVTLVFIGPVKLKYIGLVIIIIDVISIAGSNAGGHIAHLGGAVFGYLYGTSMRSGTDFLSFAHPLLGKFTGFFVPKQHHLKVNKNTSPRFEHIRQEPPLHSQKEIDAVLDKIAKSGYDSLNKDEKELLFRISSKK